MYLMSNKRHLNACYVMLFALAHPLFYQSRPTLPPTPPAYLPLQPVHPPLQPEPPAHGLLLVPLEHQFPETCPLDSACAHPLVSN